MTKKYHSLLVSKVAFQSFLNCSIVWNNFNFDPKVKICYFYVYIIQQLSSNMNEESFEFTQYNLILQEKFVVTVFEILQ